MQEPPHRGSPCARRCRPDGESRCGFRIAAGLGQPHAHLCAASSQIGSCDRASYSAVLERATSELSALALCLLRGLGADPWDANAGLNVRRVCGSLDVSRRFAEIGLLHGARGRLGSNSGLLRWIRPGGGCFCRAADLAGAFRTKNGRQGNVSAGIGAPHGSPPAGGSEHARFPRGNSDCGLAGCSCFRSSSHRERVPDPAAAAVLLASAERPRGRSGPTPIPAS